MADSVVVVAPHPDDEVLGCGGSMARLRAAGRDVHVVYLTSGEQGGGASAASLGEVREREAQAAAAVLGVPAGCLRFLRIADGGIDPYDAAQVGMVVRLLRQLRPGVVYLPHEADGSFDHEAAHRLVMRAAGMSGSSAFPDLGEAHWVATLLGYEVWAPMARPAYLEDVEPFAAVKRAALGCYASQRDKGPDQATHVGPAGLALAAYRGASSTGGHREAFAVLRLGRVFW